jgi:hypothetical protein
MWLQDAAYFYEPNPRQWVGSPAWLYHCGLRGNGVLTFDLVNHYGFPAMLADNAPQLDGRLEEPCWRNAKRSPFQDVERLALAPYTQLKFLRDDAFLYVGFRRRFVAAADRPAGHGEAFQLYLTDDKRKQAVRFGVQSDDKVFDEGGEYKQKHTRLDRAWQSGWRHVIRTDARGWVAEIAIPLASLKALGLNPQKLYLNAMTRLMTRHGRQEIYLLDPIFQFSRCVRFLPLFTPSATVAERTFTVRIHSTGAPGQSPNFAIKVQGRDMPMPKIDATGRQAATICIRELRGVRAGETMTIEMHAADNGATPVINAVEILETQTQ